MLRLQPRAIHIVNGSRVATSEGRHQSRVRVPGTLLQQAAATRTFSRAIHSLGRTLHLPVPSFPSGRSISNFLPSISTHSPTPTTTELATMADRKRAAPAGTTSAAPSKKRKTDNVQKYYAVKAGFKPGVYLTYAECQAETAGFRGAVFKSFTSTEDAEAFVAGRKVQAAADEPERFYAVAVGNPTGIYRDWTDAALAIKGVKGPKYKRFANRAEAVAYIKQFGNREAIEALGEVAEPTLAPAKKAKVAKDEGIRKPADDALHIYTDGSSLANGKVGSRAGLGVFFGAGDARNISERLQGEPQTNQRAELMAILRALETAPLGQAVQIFSDSQYSIKCVTQWALGWKNKNWMTATGQKVKNQDIIRSVLDKMEERTRAGGVTYFQWVKGHSTDRGNIAADALAVRGAKMP